MNGAQRDLDAAIAELTAALQKKRKPSHYHARAILIALGERVLEGDLSTAAAATERVGTLVRERLPEWQRAVREELELAGTEFVRSVDPRFLTHPRYDFAYTVAARERLEARLVAADQLGIAPDEVLLQQIAQADQVLAPHLGRLDARGPGRNRGRSTPG